MLPEEALQLIQADAGKRFDVKVVAAFLALHHGDPLALSEIGDTRICMTVTVLGRCC